MTLERGTVVLVELDPTLGHEQRGVRPWVSDLPADEGLVDVDAGTPVRWVEGKGWKKGRA